MSCCAPALNNTKNERNLEGIGRNVRKTFDAIRRPIPLPCYIKLSPLALAWCCFLSRRLLRRSSRAHFQKAADTRLRHMTSTKVFPALTKGELKSQKVKHLFQEETSYRPGEW